MLWYVCLPVLFDKELSVQKVSAEVLKLSLPFSLVVLFARYRVISLICKLHAQLVLNPISPILFFWGEEVWFEQRLTGVEICCSLTMRRLTVDKVRDYESYCLNHQSFMERGCRSWHSRYHPLWLVPLMWLICVFSLNIKTKDVLAYFPHELSIIDL